MSSTREKGISSRDSKGSRKVDIKTKTEQGKGEETQLENVLMPRRGCTVWTRRLPESEIVSGAQRLGSPGAAEQFEKVH